MDCGGSVPAPDWILDRRGSGCLFWRREEEPGGKRVKFRCEVEVLEFWPSEEERRPAPVRCRVEEMPPPSPLMAAFCMAGILALLSYQWLLP